MASLALSSCEIALGEIVEVNCDTQKMPASTLAKPALAKPSPLKPVSPNKLDSLCQMLDGLSMVFT
ncbi:MAG: hypothetical protein H7Z18_09510 [Methylophilaceae bacterium]|nr:hypothetical protein [Methylophilaceae bacterium]